MNPSRANAAQLAARNIRSNPKARGFKSKSLVRNTEVDVDAAPLFAPIPDKNAPIRDFVPGGLFGGGVQAPSNGFAFEAASKVDYSAEREKRGLNDSFTDVNDGSGRFAGDNRALKRTFGGSTTESTPHTFAPKETKGAFTRTMVNPYDPDGPQPVQDTQSQQPPNLFNFNSTPAEPIKFFGQAQTSAPPASSIFASSSFGNTQNPASSSMFGNAQTIAPAANSIFASSSFSNTQNLASSSMFGNAQTSAPAASSIFASSNSGNTQNSSSSMFGNAQTSAPSTNNLFGSVQSSAPVNTFGNNSFQNNESNGNQHTSQNTIFGSNSSQNQGSGVSQFTSQPQPPMLGVQNSNNSFHTSLNNEVPQALQVQHYNPNQAMGYGVDQYMTHNPSMSNNNSFQNQQSGGNPFKGFDGNGYPIFIASISDENAFGGFTRYNNSLNNSFQITNPGSIQSMPQHTPNPIFTSSTPSATFNSNFAGNQSMSHPQSQLPHDSSAQSNSGLSFGGSQSIGQPAGNLFGTASPSKAPQNNFGAVQSSHNNNFGSSLSSAQPMNSFGASAPSAGQAKPNMFGTLSQAPVSLTPQVNHNTQPEVNHSVPTPSQTSNLFGASKPLFPTSSTTLNANEPIRSEDNSGINGERNIGKTSSLFGKFASPTKAPSNPSNIFSNSASLNLPSTASQPPPSGMFPPLSQPAPNTASLNESSGPNIMPSPKKMLPGSQDKLAIEKCQMKMKAIMNKPDSDYLNAEPIPVAIQELAKTDPNAFKQYVAISRLKDINVAMAKMWQEVHWSMDPAELLEHYLDQRVQILKATGYYEGPLKRKNREDDVDTRPQKRSNIESLSQTQDSQPRVNGFNLQATNPSNEAPATSPSKANHQVAMTSTELQQPLSNGPITNGNETGLTHKSAFFTDSPSKPSSTESGSYDANNSPGKPAPVPTPSGSKGKRKAEDELTQNTEPADSLRPLRATKTQKRDGSFTAVDEGSNTSAIFNSILNTPVKPRILAGKTAEKPATVDKPRINPFGGLPVPRSNSTSETEAPTPIRSNASNAVPPVSSSTPNMFSIKGGATACAPNMFTSKDATKSGIFGSTSALSAPVSSNLFSPVKNTSSAQTEAADPKAAQKESAPAPGGFQFKPQATTSTSPFHIKPPTSSSTGSGPPQFGNLSGSSAMEQFRQKAKQDEEAKERKLMEEAKDNDWDSEDEDETESDFERKWYAKRAEEKEQQKKDIEAAMKNGGGFTFKPSQSTSNGVGSSLFAPSVSGQGAGNSPADSINGSRTPTPGPFGSAAGSVLGGSSSTLQPVKNIFGHLSDTGSGKDDKDDESDDADDEDDSENKDPNYMPSAENHSSPGTPAEETGAGIASSKKSALFGFSNGISSPTPTSGTSTPGRSLFDRIGPRPVPESNDEKPAAAPLTGGLFDRIGKNSNRNPIQHISSDEKENTQPTSSDIFKTSTAGSIFSKSTAAPADQTWKQNSPIKFGSSTAPSVSFTAATPTKTPTSLFGTSTEASKGSIFGQTSTTATPSLLSGFGTNGTNGKPATPSVGFAFGAAPSTASSLFPSAATSRGTSPGNTTDGASDADADPDVVYQAQIDLTSGGQGEENEEVLYEVRAKAVNFDDGKWNTAGLGPLRVLKHKETGVSRVLIRADPSGKIILNHGILNLPYKAEGKTVKFVVAGEENKLETYLLQVKTPESAEKLAQILTENKAE